MLLIRNSLPFFVNDKLLLNLWYLAYLRGHPISYDFSKMSGQELSRRRRGNAPPPAPASDFPTPFVGEFGELEAKRAHGERLAKFGRRSNKHSPGPRQGRRPSLGGGGGSFYCMRFEMINNLLSIVESESDSNEREYTLHRNPSGWSTKHDGRIEEMPKNVLPKAKAKSWECLYTIFTYHIIY